jgi:hypothetical protein
MENMQIIFLFSFLNQLRRRTTYSPQGGYYADIGGVLLFAATQKPQGVGGEAAKFSLT